MIDYEDTRDTDPMIKTYQTKEDYQQMILALLDVVVSTEACISQAMPLIEGRDKELAENLMKLQKACNDTFNYLAHRE